MKIRPLWRDSGRGKGRERRGARQNDQAVASFRFFFRWRFKAKCKWGSGVVVGANQEVFVLNSISLFFCFLFSPNLACTEAGFDFTVSVVVVTAQGSPTAHPGLTPPASQSESGSRRVNTDRAEGALVHKNGGGGEVDKENWGRGSKAGASGFFTADVAAKGVKRSSLINL